MSADQHIDELLSGFLDGRLSADEHRQLDTWLEAEPTAREHLRMLQQIRTDMQQIPKQRLGADFSARVIEAARREAMASGLPADHFVLAEVMPATVKRIAFWESPRKVAGLIAALAASIVLVTLVVNDSLNIGPKKDQLVVEDAETQDQRNQNGDIEDSVNSPFPQVAPMLATKDGWDAVDSGNGAETNLPVRNSPASRKPIQMLLIYDLKVTQQAWDLNVLGTILENSGIRWSDPIFANAQVASSLAKTRSIVQNSPQEDLQDDLALILVSASAKALGKAMDEILQRAKDFPSATFDIAFDLPDQYLLRSLSEAIGNTTGQTARPLLLTAWDGASLDDAAQFSTSSEFDSSDDRPNAPSSSGLESEDDAPSYALLVVRKPSKQ